MEKVAKKIEPDSIHIQDFKSCYDICEAKAADAVFTGGREVFTLNGTWKYAIDQYETFLRQKWFREIYKTGEGYSLPELFSNSNPSKPVIVTEFGADALAGYHGFFMISGVPEEHPSYRNITTERGFLMKQKNTESPHFMYFRIFIRIRNAEFC